MEKPVRIKDPALLRSFHSRQCISCGAFPSDPDHIRTRGAGGNDEEANLLALCRRCHVTRHSEGIVTFASRRPHVYHWLVLKGWRITCGKLVRAS